MSVEFQNAYGWMTLPAMIVAAAIWLPLYDKRILPGLLQSARDPMAARYSMFAVGGWAALMVAFNIALAALIAGLA